MTRKSYLTNSSPAKSPAQRNDTTPSLPAWDSDLDELILDEMTAGEPAPMTDRERERPTDRPPAGSYPPPHLLVSPPSSTRLTAVEDELREQFLAVRTEAETLRILIRAREKARPATVEAACSKLTARLNALISLLGGGQ